MNTSEIIKVNYKFKSKHMRLTFTPSGLKYLTSHRAWWNAQPDTWFLGYLFAPIHLKLSIFPVELKWKKCTIKEFMLEFTAWFASILNKFTYFPMAVWLERTSMSTGVRLRLASLVLVCIPTHSQTMWNILSRSTKSTAREL